MSRLSGADPGAGPGHLCELAPGHGRLLTQPETNRVDQVIMVADAGWAQPDHQTPAAMIAKTGRSRSYVGVNAPKQ
jgi:hypothetical protein